MPENPNQTLASVGKSATTSNDMPTPELNALEAYLASNPDTINRFLDCKFKDLSELVNSLGFDAQTIIDELQPTGIISERVWVESVDTNKHDIAELTVVEYCQQYPDVGTPLVASVLNAIQLSEEQEKLLSKAGGTNLSKAQKWEIGAGTAVGGIAVLYLVPRLIKHLGIKQAEIAVRDALGDYDGLTKFSTWENGTSQSRTFVGTEWGDGKAEFVLIKRSGTGWSGLDVKFEKFSDRLAYEWQSSLPYTLYKKLFPEKANKNEETIKSQVDQDLDQDVDSNYNRLSNESISTEKMNNTLERNATRAEVEPGRELTDLEKNTAFMDDTNYLIAKEEAAASKPGSIKSYTDNEEGLLDEQLDNQISGEIKVGEGLNNDISNATQNGIDRVEKAELNMLQDEMDVVAKNEEQVIGKEAKIYAGNEAQSVITEEVDSAEVVIDEDIQSTETIAEDEFEELIP